jgi:probable rRNA maturation factor
VPNARKHAIAHGHPLATEIKVLILHGLLHLAGYDHEADEGKMARRERQLRAKLGLPQGLIERVAAQTRGKRASGAKAHIDGRLASRGLKAPAPTDKGPTSSDRNPALSDKSPTSSNTGLALSVKSLGSRVAQVRHLGPGEQRTQSRRGRKP